MTVGAFPFGGSWAEAWDIQRTVQNEPTWRAMAMRFMEGYQMVEVRKLSYRKTGEEREKR